MPIQKRGKKNIQFEVKQNFKVNKLKLEKQWNGLCTLDNNNGNFKIIFFSFGIIMTLFLLLSQSLANFSFEKRAWWFKFVRMRCREEVKYL